MGDESRQKQSGDKISGGNAKCGLEMPAEHMNYIHHPHVFNQGLNARLSFFCSKYLSILRAE